VKIKLQNNFKDRVRAPWLYPILVQGENSDLRDALMKELFKKNIETRPFFIPVHLMPPYQQMASNLKLPVTQILSNQGLNLPTFPDMTDAQIARIADAVLKSLKAL
jgi:perosamine synthetase